MLKLYKQIDGKLHYNEAWAEPENEAIVEHWGVIGEKGETKNHPLAPDLDEDEQISLVLSSAAENGFAPFDDDDMRILLVEYAVEGMGTKADVKKRQDLEGVLNESLGWTGLGHCDGGSIGSGTMEACCYVVDFGIAKDVLIKDLAETRFGDYTRIYDENA
ncbi:hypothetical protein [Marilutibacter alkalisoli]|uniref:WGR domain-containing protein n=1 Tax=Marilutibacter alkalisoli TaxID=2591633 RepID=A0A514BTY2_9GAMM|nr:hypothetical protein [Lysobacter alkalisoli]QDH70755.1 hypothetical protein FKV23_12185 [Lysobacter alkalisoli]